MDSETELLHASEQMEKLLELLDGIESEEGPMHTLLVNAYNSVQTVWDRLNKEGK